MPITILDYVKSVVRDKDEYTAEDFYRWGVDMLGGCERCHATIAAYNAYPSTSGFWRCADCIGDDGFDTATDFVNAEFNRCPGCGALDSIYETRITVSKSAESYALKCDQCGLTWTDPT